MTDAGAVRVEIGVESLEGVRIADAAGATRVELCTGLSVGGLTPNIALIEAAVAAASKVQVHVLIRPRPGDFRYSADEVALMRADVERVRSAAVAPPSRRNPAVPHRLDRVVLRALAREVEDRTPWASDLARELLADVDPHGARALSALLGLLFAKERERQLAMH